MTWKVMTVVLALAMGVGCRSANKVTEEDRVVLDQMLQAAELMKATMAAVTGDPTAVQKLNWLVYELTESGGVLQGNWGKPKEPVPLTPESAKVAREKAKGSHDVGFWAMLGGAVLTGLGLAVPVIRAVGKFIPGIGPIWSTVDGLILGAEKAMARLKAGGNEAAADVVSEALADAQKDPRVKAYVEKKLTAVKEKYSVDLTGILAPKPAAPPPEATAAK